MSTTEEEIAAQPVRRQGNYAGAVTRLVAFAVDVGAAWGLFSLGIAGIDFAVQLVTGHQFSLHKHQVFALVAIVVWVFVYFAYQWSLGGKTIGMALLGIRVVRTDGTPVRSRQAVIRTLTFPLSFLFFGLGFLGILLNRDRHAWHDRLAGGRQRFLLPQRAGSGRLRARREPADPEAAGQQHP